MRFGKAKTYLKTKARRLERAIFEYEFEGGELEGVLKELKRYQNEDGGFGRGLEPDVRCRHSSALATSIALGHLTKFNLGHDNEMVQKAVAYLLNTYNRDRMGWIIVPKEVETAPRAIWWNDRENWQWGNPSAEIIGLLYHHRSLVPPALLNEMIGNAIHYINQVKEYEHHEFLSFLRFFDYMPEQEQAMIFPKLKKMAKECITHDPNKWDFYCLQPLQVVKSPDSLFYPIVKEIIPQNLEYIARNQEEEGYWNPNWAWGQFEDHWETAKEDWRGVLTLEHVRVLNAFGK